MMRGQGELSTETVRRRSKTTVDKLGMPIDEEIRDTLAGFWRAGIKTTGSCAGHEERGLPYPWIDLEKPDEETQALLKKALPSFKLEAKGVFGDMRLQPQKDNLQYSEYEAERSELTAFGEKLLLS